MGLSAPPPSWATVLGKPTTMSGFGITDGVTSQTAGSGINISGATGAVTVNANNTPGAIGTYVIAQLNSFAQVTRNSNYSGSSLTGQWDDGINFGNASLGFTGTWRAINIASQAAYINSSVITGVGNWLFQRMA